MNSLTELSHQKVELCNRQALDKLFGQETVSRRNFISAREITPTNNLQTLSIPYKKDQHTLWQILGIWLVGSAPTWLLGWVAFPALSAGLPLMDAGLLRMTLLTVELIR